MQTLQRALKWLDACPGVRVDAASAIRRTPPLGPRQPDYANAVARLRTRHPPRCLLSALHAMESSAGRLRGEPWGPRTLDLDLLLFGEAGELVYRDLHLVLPHPELAKRQFVLEPLCDLDPDLVHPELDRTMRQLLEAVQS